MGNWGGAEATILETTAKIIIRGNWRGAEATILETTAKLQKFISPHRGIIYTWLVSHMIAMMLLYIYPLSIRAYHAASMGWEQSGYRNISNFQKVRHLITTAKM